MGRFWGFTSYAEGRRCQHSSRRFGIPQPVCHQLAEAVRSLPDGPKARVDADLRGPANIGFDRSDRFSHESY